MRTSSLLCWVQSSLSSLPVLARLLTPHVLQLAITVALIQGLGSRAANSSVGSDSISLLVGLLGVGSLGLLQGFWIAGSLRRLSDLAHRLIPQRQGNPSAFLHRLRFSEIQNLQMALTMLANQRNDRLKDDHLFQVFRRDDATRLVANLFDQSVIGMTWTDVSGQYLCVNDAFCNLLGYTKAELQHRRWQQLTHPDDLGADLQMMGLMHAGEIDAFSIEKRFLRKDGQTQWTCIHVTQIRDQAGNIESYGVIVQDISERKRAETALKQQAEGERLITQVTRRMCESTNGIEIIQIAVDEARQLLKTDRVMIYRFETAGAGAVIVESVAGGWPKILDKDRQDFCLDTPEYADAKHQGQVQAVADILNAELDHDYVTWLRQYEVRANLTIPILQGGERWGLLLAQHCTGPRQWCSQEIDWLQQIASQMAIAVQKQQLYTQMQHQLQREQAITKVIRAIGRSLDLSAVFATAVAEIALLLQVDRVSIARYLSEEKLWRNLATHSTSDQLPSDAAPEIPDEANAVAAQLKQLQVVQIADAVRQCQDPINQALAEQFPGAWLLVPIAIDGCIWGALSAIKINFPEPWKEPDVEIARTMADQLAIAIQQSQLYLQVQKTNETLKHLAIMDGLTQIANRRYFNDQLTQEWQRMLRQQQPLSLIMCDVDAFKPYNDTYGHQAGDACLQNIAATLQQVVKRPSDLIARYGGEEFAVVLPTTHLDGAIQVAESIRSAIEKLQVPHRTSPAAPYVTVSLGVTSRIPKSNFSVDKLIQLADQALYLAKSAGRNCYRVNPSPSRYIEQ
ncbi:MAG: diguanylate cyclase [Cyanobacteria bacterium J06642_9]